MSTTGYSGQTLIVKVWVKLGTATNFDLILNNTLASNSIGGQSFTSTHGLNGSAYTQVSYSFTAPTSNAINIHVGSNVEIAVPRQTAGTVFTYGWQIFVKGKKVHF